MSTLIRVGSPHVIVRMAELNHLSYTHTRYAASVTLAGCTYFWSAA